MDTSGNAHDTDMAALMTLLDDVRCDLLEVQKTFASVDKTFTMQDFRVHLENIWSVVTHPPETQTEHLLEEVLHVLAPAPQSRPWWHRWRWPGAVVLAAVLGLGIGGWLMRPSAEVRAWAQLGQRLDGLLIEQGLGLARSTQEALGKLYRDLGMVAPSERKGKKA